MGSIKLKNEGIISKETETKQVQAEEIKIISKSEIAESVGQSGTDFDDPAILYKDESRTDVYSEHYVMNNGTAKTVISAKPVNYYDEETKKWGKIDLTAKEKDGYYESRAGSVAARFSKPDAGTDAQKVEMVSGKQTISWEYVGKASDGTIKSRMKAAALRMNKSEDKSETAVYEEAEPNTDIEYAFDGKNLKETIIVKEKSREYKYNFIMDTHGLNVRLSENNDSIEVYTAEDKEKGIEEKVEFYIPSPVMWDAEGNMSEEVYYEIGKSADGKYEFAVIANEEWINAEERAFPITIDPQIITTENNALTYQVRRKYVSPENGQPTGWHTVTSWNIYAYNDSEVEYRTQITVNKSFMSLLAEKIASVKLSFSPISDFAGYISCGEETKYYDSASGNLEIDVTGLFLRAHMDFEMEMSTTTIATEIKFSENATITIEYLTDESIEPTMKTFAIAGSVSGLLNLATRDCSFSFVDVSAENSVMGIPVIHTCKRSKEDFCAGQSYRLNLNENFKKYTERDYVYTDSMGYKHAFHDYYYYIDNLENKIYIDDKSKIDVEADGNLAYYTGQKYKVNVEYKSHTGLKAITELEGFHNNRWLEQRSDEVKQIEEKIDGYRKVFEEFVIVDISKENEIIIIDDLSRYLSINNIILFVNQISDEKILLTKTETYTYQSLFWQYKSLDENENNSDPYAQNKKEVMLAQLEHYKNKSSDNLTQLTQYYKEYRVALNEAKKLKQHTPVNFLIDGKVYKGYNSNGDLVIIFDTYENYAKVEYEPYYLGHTEKFRIASLSDNKNNIVSFVYNSINRLSEIIDTRGNKTQYIYHVGGLLLQTKYNSVDALSITYDWYNLTSVTNHRLNLFTQLDHLGTSPVQIRNYSTVTTLSDGQIQTDNTYINHTDISYDVNAFTATITNDYVKEKYTFNSDNTLIEYAKEENGVVVQAENYEYVPYWIGNIQQQNPRKVVIKADKSCLHTSPLGSFSFVAGETQTSVLNQFNDPITTTVSGIKLNADGTNTLTSVTTYTYDYNQKVIEEQTSEQYTNLQKPINSYVRYNYNSSGDIIRKESFIVDEEYTNGKTVEETVYDDKGNVIKTFTYNTLDASSKYYTEQKLDENGNVISEANDAGENYTEYEYAENSGELNTVKHVNGSKFSYGRDADGTVISITQSDENGEGNSTELSYTCGELTKATSGNNTVKYTYDGKRRVTQIDLNGTEEYLKNTYIDNVTHYNLNLNYVETENKKEEKFKRWFYKSGEVKQVDYNNDTVLLYDFNAKMQVTSVSDSVASITHTYLYDALDRQIKHSFGTSSIETEFDAFGSVSKTTYKFSAADSDKVEYTFTYSEDSKRMLKRLAVGAFIEDYTTDVLGRTKTVVKTFGNKTYGTDYGYYKVGDHATNLINTVYKLNDGVTKDKITYTYDAMGNIISVNENGRQKYKYNYDKLGRLLSEIDVLNDNKEIVYTYDNKGNILTKTEEGNTIHYTYEEGTDKLLSYGNESFVYDVIGNPTTFRNMTATWNKGRQLTSLNNGTNTVSYTYDGFGLRKSKTVGGVTTKYIYADGKLLRQTGSNTIDFIYGADGITGIKVNNDYSYLFMKNIQGDVEKIISADGTVVGEYAYTAFGKCTIITNTDNIAEINPIRYRGYYYDEDMHLYYLKSRYYDPELGRFMTIDDISYIDTETINGLNLYAYCGNNPVMRVDENGTAWWHWVVAVVIVVVITAITAGAAAAVAGALGATAATIQAVAVGAAIGGLVTGGVELVSQGIETNWQTVDLGSIAIETFTGALYGGAFGALGATTSVGLRLGMRGAIVVTSGLNAALHGINEGKSFGDTMTDVGISIGASLLLQGVMLGRDARIGKLSTSVLELYKLDGALFMLKDKLKLAGIAAWKNIWRNKEKWGLLQFN